MVYDKDRKTVELEEPAREVDLYMEVVTPYGVTWAGVYRRLCTAGFLAVLAADLDISLFGAVQDVLVVTVLLVVLGLAASYQLWHRRWFVIRALVE